MSCNNQQLLKKADQSVAHALVLAHCAKIVDQIDLLQHEEGQQKLFNFRKLFFSDAQNVDCQQAQMFHALESDLSNTM